VRERDETVRVDRAAESAVKMASDGWDLPASPSRESVAQKICLWVSYRTSWDSIRPFWSQASDEMAKNFQGNFSPPCKTVSISYEPLEQVRRHNAIPLEQGRRLENTRSLVKTVVAAVCELRLLRPLPVRSPKLRRGEKREMPHVAWERLLRQLPAKEQDGLMLMTNTRTEIAVQSILRLDSDFLIIKGRLAGSQDAGRVFFIPYAHIDHLGFYRAVKDTEFDEMFADLNGPPLPAAAVAPEPAADESKTPMKSAVLERFRSRGSSTSIARGSLAPRLEEAPNGHKAE
jgi:hypothetical protein